MNETQQFVSDDVAFSLTRKHEYQKEALITLTDAAIRIGGRFLLPGTSWEIRPGQQWAVIGPNGAGKSSLVRAIAGELPVVRGRLIRHSLESHDIAYISFERHRQLIAREENRDHARYFSGTVDDILTVQDVLASDSGNPRQIRTAADRMGIGHLLEQGIRHLSTGEMRKMLIAQALSRSPRLLILDEPFDGLDEASRKELTALIEQQMQSSVQMILITHRFSEIPSGITHVLTVKDGCTNIFKLKNGSLNPADIFRSLAAEPSRTAAPQHLITDVLTPLPSISRSSAPLIEIKNLNVRYGKTPILKNVSWTLNPKEHWTILGPNGAGKSTLLRLISGDHLQAYSNDIWLFGQKRGSGESIWEIKQHMGIVSSEMQIRYRKTITALEAVISGFFDSVGLYQRETDRQRKRAEALMKALGLEKMKPRRFDHLSYGEQRMVLTARALVKHPSLLILDEPCQGLDAGNRDMVLHLIESIGRHSDIQLLYVTHHPEEMPECTTHVIRLVPHEEGGFTAEKSAFPL